MINIHYSVKLSSRRRTMAIQVSTNGEVVVRAPRNIPKEAADKFVREHADWIEGKRAEMERRKKEAPDKKFVDGEKFLFLGSEFPLRLEPGLPEIFSFNKKDGFAIATECANKRGVFEAWYNYRASEIIPARLIGFIQQIGAYPRRVRIGDAKTRWGSCGATGNLNFSWRLVMAPIEVIDYVAAHEAAHLAELNHSPKFWRIVEQLVPNHRHHRAWLKNNGHRLKL